MWHCILQCLIRVSTAAASHQGLHCFLRPVCPNTYGKYCRYNTIEYIKLTLLVPKFTRHLSSAFLFLTNYYLKRSLYVNLKRLNVKQRRSRWDGSYEPSHLVLCCLQKLIIIACGSERVNLVASINSLCLVDSSTLLS